MSPANISYDQKLGRYQAAYVGAPPWHGLGQMVDDAMTPAQALEAAGTGFIVDKAPVVAVIDGKPVDVPEYRATYRTDTGQVLGVVSADYAVIQNLTPMEMLNEIVRTKEAGIVSHAALGKGERLFAVLDLKRLTDIRIPGDPSRHDAFIVSQWWHDGTGALSFGPSMIRVDCQNMANAQLDYATRKGMLVRIVHMGDTTGAVEQARQVLGYAEKSIDAFVDLMSRLGDIAVPPRPEHWLDGFLERLIPIPPEMERTGTRTEARDAIRSLYLGSSTLVGVGATAYRAFNAVTEYADHVRPLRVKDPQLVPAKRFATAIDGPAAVLKETALSLLRQEFEV